jgi:ethanolamine ammonia-lyase small subunit
MTDADRQAIANLVLAGIPHAPTAAEVADELQRRLQG